MQLHKATYILRCMFNVGHLIYNTCLLYMYIIVIFKLWLYTKSCFYKVKFVELTLHIWSEKDQPKKKVRFSDDVVELSLENKEYLHKKNVSNSSVLITPQNLEGADKKMRDTMPLNWQVLYKGIIEFRKNTTNCTYKST